MVKNTINFLFWIVFAVFFYSCKKGKGAICNDGWRSHSTGSGTCSWHGGVDHYLDPNEIDIGKTTFLIIISIIVLIIFIKISRQKP
jgi:hypothetical protein